MNTFVITPTGPMWLHSNNNEHLYEYFCDHTHRLHSNNKWILPYSCMNTFVTTPIGPVKLHSNNKWILYIPIWIYLWPHPLALWGHILCDHTHWPCSVSHRASHLKSSNVIWLSCVIDNSRSKDVIGGCFTIWVWCAPHQSTGNQLQAHLWGFG